MSVVTRITASMPRPLRRRLMALPYTLQVLSKFGGTTTRECPLCGYVGKFAAFGHPPRYDVECKKCGSMERHRLLKLALDRGHLVPDGATVIHFAPEPIITNLLKNRTDYKTADIREGRADLVLNIENLALPDNSVDIFMANHVLEHVDDSKALPELFRALKPGGSLIVTIPISEGLDTSYEDPAITSKKDRAVHFGRYDHVRLYGRDFRDRVRAAHFDLEEVVAEGAEAIRFGMTPGDRVFVAKKPIG